MTKKIFNFFILFFFLFSLSAVHLIYKSDLAHYQLQSDVGKLLVQQQNRRKQKIATAIHEAGHTILVLEYKKIGFKFVKATIIPKNNASGFTTFSYPTYSKIILGKKVNKISKKVLEGLLLATLAGKIAEEIILGRMFTNSWDKTVVDSDFAQYDKKLKELKTLGISGQTFIKGAPIKVEGILRRERNKLLLFAKALLVVSESELNKKNKNYITDIDLNYLNQEYKLPPRIKEMMKPNFKYLDFSLFSKTDADLLKKLKEWQKVNDDKSQTFIWTLKNKIALGIYLFYLLILFWIIFFLAKKNWHMRKILR